MNRDELSVYADQLQIEGDVRGEIIAIELLPPRPDLEVRHEALMQKWLGADYRGWRGVRFRHGFVDCLSGELERILATTAGPFLRSVFVAGNNTEIVQALRLLAATPRPHLSRLSIVTGRRFSERRAPRATILVDDALTTAVISATPALSDLDVTGNRVFDTFSHPALQRLRLAGYDAICAVAEAGAPLPAVRSLFYAFAPDHTGRIPFPEHGLPQTLLARTTLPALVDLDVSANELQRSWDNDHVALFELLVELGVLPHLARLRVPPLVSDDERAALDHVRSLTRAAIEVADDRPRPLHDAIEGTFVLGVRIHNHELEHRISLQRLGELMSDLWPEHDAEDRAAWHALWRAAFELPVEPEPYWGYEVGNARLHRLALLETPLVTLGEHVDDNLSIAILAAALAHTHETQLTMRRYEY